LATKIAVRPAGSARAASGRGPLSPMGSRPGPAGCRPGSTLIVSGGGGSGWGLSPRGGREIVCPPGWACCGGGAACAARRPGWAGAKAKITRMVSMIVQRRVAGVTVVLLGGVLRVETCLHLQDEGSAANLSCDLGSGVKLGLRPSPREGHPAYG